MFNNREAMLEAYVDTAKMFAVSEEGCAPIVFLFLEKKPPLAIPANFSNDDEKGFFIASIRKLAKQHGAYAGVWITEAWALAYDKDEAPDYDSDDYVRPSESPDRKELLTVIASDHTGSSFYSAEIKRNGDKVWLENENTQHEGCEDRLFGDTFRKVLQ